jgi:hypothetical protein
MRLKMALSFAAAALLVYHVFRKEIPAGSVTVTLIIAAILPWVSELLKTIEMPGGWKLEFHDLKREVVKHEDLLRELVIYSVSEACYKHLWWIAKSPEYKFWNNDPMARQMYFLSDNGLIQPRFSGFLNFDQEMDQKNLVDLAKLTPAGEFLIQLRGAPTEFRLKP